MWLLSYESRVDRKEDMVHASFLTFSQFRFFFQVGGQTHLSIMWFSDIPSRRCPADT